MKEKFRYIYLAAALVVAIVGTVGVVGLCRKAQTALPVGIGVEDCSGTVESFCTLLEDGNYEELQGLIHGYVDLHLNAEPGSDTVERIRDKLRESYETSVVGESRVSGMNAEQDVRIEYFDIELAKKDAKQIANEYYAAKMESAQSNEELYDSSGDLLESVALEVFDEALDTVFDSPDSSKYHTSKTITLELVYNRGRWEIILTDDLAGVLLGGVS